MIAAHGNGRSHQLPSKRWRPRASSRAAQTNVAAIDCSYGWARSVGSVLPIPTWILFFGGVLVFCRLCWCGLSLLSDCCGAGRQGRQGHRDNDDKEAHEVLVAEHTPSWLQRNPGLGVRGSDLTALSDAQTISDDVEFPPGSLIVRINPAVRRTHAGSDGRRLVAAKTPAAETRS
jgi:hypothetical protein